MFPYSQQPVPLDKDSATMLRSINGNTVQFYIKHLNHGWARQLWNFICILIKVNIDVFVIKRVCVQQKIGKRI